MEIDIERVAKVARIKLNEQERKEYQEYLKSILRAFEIIKKVDTNNVEPSYLPINIKNKMRNDTPKESKGKELLKLTNLTQDGYFIGPKAK